MDDTRAPKPGGGRKPSKPEYSAVKNLAQQMKAAADLYTDKMSLQAIVDALSLNSIKVRKLLITAGVYESDTAKLVRQTFHSFRETFHQGAVDRPQRGQQEPCLEFRDAGVSQYR